MNTYLYTIGMFPVIIYQTSDREAMFVAQNNETFMVGVLDCYTAQQDKGMYSTVSPCDGLLPDLSLA